MPAFDPVPAQVSFPELEQRIQRLWDAEDPFEAALRQRAQAPAFTFYEGPPTANGRPGVHHVLARAFKDGFLRYQQMLGRRVERRAGWDTHGLPVELEVERRLGLHSKAEIERHGVAAFNRLCRQSVAEFIGEWEQLTRRIGFWLDMQSPYRTYDPPYIESVWWSLKQIWDRGWLYQGYRVSPYCPRCQTSLSTHELNQGYREDTPDTAVTVRFRLVDEPQTSILAWTTTPWTLPGNVGLAVGPEIEYVRVRQGAERLILARERLSLLQGPYEVEGPVPASELVGRRYQPLYPQAAPEGDAFRVVAATFVSTTEGTGVVHTAGAYGEDDLLLCQQEGLPVRHTVGLDGCFLPMAGAFAGLFVKDADPRIVEDLEGRGLLYRADPIRHTYPFCWRCETPLLYYALTSWFIRTTAVKERLLVHNQSVQWVPAHLRDGRMGNWLESLQDWNLSRDRYWGTPLPIWICPDCDAQRCVGSFAELGLPADADPHKPFIDEVQLACACGGAMRRVPQVIDAWYDSGAMPYAQWHYPFENADRFAGAHPADFICEAIDQTRGWFFTLLAESVLLFDQPAYRHVVSPSHVVDGAGQKMSKSRGNIIEPLALLDAHGADALRWWFYTTVTVGQEYRVSPERIAEVVKRFLLILWNVQSFLVTYANLCGWDPGAAEAVPAPAERSVLDRWLLARVAQTTAEVRRRMDLYDATVACRQLAQLVDDASTWYVRRSRARFRGEEATAACATLHQALRTMARLLAPFVPFVSDALWRQLSVPLAGQPSSVHLTDYPEVRSDDLDPELLEAMARLRRLVEEAHAQRERARLPLRQPLAAVTVAGAPFSAELAAVLAEELNVREVRYAPVPADGRETVSLDLALTPELRDEGWVRTLGRRGQELRRAAGLRPGQPIDFYVEAADPLGAAVLGQAERLTTLLFADRVQRVTQGARPAVEHSAEGTIDGTAYWLGLVRRGPASSLPAEDGP